MDGLLLPLFMGAFLALSLIGMGAFVVFGSASPKTQSEGQVPSVGVRSSATGATKAPTKKAA